MEYNNNLIIRECKVLAVEYTDKNDKGGLRIKVHIGREDSDWNGNLDNLPWCYPLLPKHFHLNPKLGETVLVILSRTDQPKKRRWFVGPLISQQYFLDYESDDSFQTNVLLDYQNNVPALLNPKNNPDNEGSLPDPEDIAIQGRNNTDLILKKNELRVRCGFKKYPYSRSSDVDKSLVFNDEDMGYIQMKYNANLGNNGGWMSTINIVADRINLLTHQKNTNTPFNLLNKKELITNEEQTKIENEAHPLIFGDDFMNFLKNFIEIFRTHTHPFPTKPPSLNKNHVDTLNTDLKTMLSKAIKIN